MSYQLLKQKGSIVAKKSSKSIFREYFLLSSIYWIDLKTFTQKRHKCDGKNKKRSGMDWAQLALNKRFCRGNHYC